MTSLLENPHRMSVAGPTFNSQEEVTTMTATTVSYRQRTRPHGFDRVVMRLSLAMLLWARRRCDRGTVSRDEHTRMLAQHAHIVRSEHSAALRITARTS